MDDDDFLLEALQDEPNFMPDELEELLAQEEERMLHSQRELLEEANK